MTPQELELFQIEHIEHKYGEYLEKFENIEDDDERAKEFEKFLSETYTEPSLRPYWLPESCTTEKCVLSLLTHGLCSFHDIDVVTNDIAIHHLRTNIKYIMSKDGVSFYSRESMIGHILNSIAFKGLHTPTGSLKKEMKRLKLMYPEFSHLFRY